MKPILLLAGVAATPLVLTGCISAGVDTAYVGPPPGPPPPVPPPPVVSYYAPDSYYYAPPTSARDADNE